MSYRSSPTLFVLALIGLFVGCSSQDPSDRVLPSLDNLSERYGPQAPGTGILVVRNSFSGDGSFEVAAEHVTTGEEYGEPTLTRFYITLRGAVGVSMSADGVTGATLRPGMELGVSVSGTGDGNRGSGRVRITAVEGEAISGVFAALLQPGGFIPDFPVVQGAFNAVLRSAEKRAPGREVAGRGVLHVHRSDIPSQPE